jgi:glycosyltransferase involved in cell wall biosynthesis
MIKGKDIIYISSIEWAFLWQAHQEIALRLAAAGNRVLYVENTGVRTPRLRDVGRVMSRLKRWARTRPSSGVREVAPNLFICSPVVLPPFGSRVQRNLNRRMFLRPVAAIARQLNMRDPLIWTYLPTDTALDLINLVRTYRSVVVYYGVADFCHLAGDRSRLEQSERELLQLSDVVFANCRELAYRFSRWNQNANVFAPGVNLSAFSSAANDASQTEGDPLDLLNIPRPRIGYIGGLHRFVDYDLLRKMAEARPDWSWIMIGAAQVDLQQLRELPNVYLLGQQPHERLFQYLKSFDACLVPYVNTAEMSTVVPTKINEYLAAGKAVVSTNLPTVCEFNEEHDVLVTAPPDPKLFLEAIERVLANPGSKADVNKRQKVAALADWELRLEAMSRLIEDQIWETAVPAKASVAV